VICAECGVVETVREVAVEPKGSGGGAVAGGVVGGIIGNQIGKGATRDIATMLGAVGGAYAGNHIEKTVKEAKRYDVIVRFEDGSTRTFSSDTPPAWQSGDRVRLQSGGLVAGNNRSGGSSGVI
jgi:outer membrane lipoprotein SlyB